MLICLNDPSVGVGVCTSASIAAGVGVSMGANLSACVGESLGVGVGMGACVLAGAKGYVQETYNEDGESLQMFCVGAT